MEKVPTLYSWIGRTDIDCYLAGDPEQVGPLAQAVLSGRFQRVRILSNWPEKKEEAYIPWLLKQLKTRGISTEEISIELQNVNLTSPTDYSSIYETLADILNINKEEEDRTFHLSPGTPAMASVWILLSTGQFPASLIETNRETGLREVILPFRIQTDFIANTYERMEALDREKSFDDIVCQADEMRNLISNAARIAVFKVPVLIFGESGTGKELISRGIHQASGREGNFVAVNCGAIPRELVESEFFGYKKGAFTGADQDHVGYLEQAHKGTIFLDEIGELPLHSQVKLLRALNNKAIRPVGSTEDKKVDIRIIAATNKNLQDEISKGHFREDLFHRLAVGIIHMPPLRDRGEDLTLLINSFTKEINRQFAVESIDRWKDRILSPDAMKVLRGHSWPGNVRELKNTLKRLIIWADRTEITGEEAQRALLTDRSPRTEDEITFIPSGFDLNNYMDELKKKWLIAAKEQSHGNMSEAARILGFTNYQTLDNWYKKYGLKDN